MRLRITQWATRDQDGDRAKTLTTFGQWIQEACASPPARSTTQPQPNNIRHQPLKRKAIRLGSTIRNDRQKTWKGVRELAKNSQVPDRFQRLNEFFQNRLIPMESSVKTLR